MNHLEIHFISLLFLLTYIFSINDSVNQEFKLRTFLFKGCIIIFHLNIKRETLI